jgi:pantoate--beta-alanine ligase
MSSRNERLAQEERAEAALIYKTLAEAKKNLQQLFQLFPNGYKKRSRQSSFYLEYFTIADEETLLSSSRKIK